MEIGMATKKITILVIILCCLTACKSIEKSNNKNTNLYPIECDDELSIIIEKSINDYKKDRTAQQDNQEFKIISNQTFVIDIESYGKVRFVSGTSMRNYPLLNLEFYLVDLNNEVLYKYPDFFANQWIFFEIKEILFQDINDDDKTDVIVNAYYMVGAGKQAGIPFPTATIFFQDDTEFVNFKVLDEALHLADKDENVEVILEYLNSHKEDMPLSQVE